MQQTQRGPTARQYKAYLLFMFIACGGAFLWQFFFSGLGGQYVSWPPSAGWQREIALWNVGILAALALALVKHNMAYLKIMTLQATVLCVLLGANHLVALVGQLPQVYGMHLLGVAEVLLVGGGWGSVLLYRTYKANRQGAQ